jgi:hypothetical protein
MLLIAMLALAPFASTRQDVGAATTVPRSSSITPATTLYCQDVEVVLVFSIPEDWLWTDFGLDRGDLDAISAKLALTLAKRRPFLRANPIHPTTRASHQLSVDLVLMGDSVSLGVEPSLKYEITLRPMGGATRVENPPTGRFAVCDPAEYSGLREKIPTIKYDWLIAAFDRSIGPDFDGQIISQVSLGDCVYFKECEPAEERFVHELALPFTWESIGLTDPMGMLPDEMSEFAIVSLNERNPRASRVALVKPIASTITIMSTDPRWARRERELESSTSSGSSFAVVEVDSVIGLETTSIDERNRFVRGLFGPTVAPEAEGPPGLSEGPRNVKGIYLRLYVPPGATPEDARTGPNWTISNGAKERPAA